MRAQESMILSIKMVNEQLFDVIFGKKMIFEITMNIIYLLDVNNPHNNNLFHCIVFNDQH